MKGELPPRDLYWHYPHYSNQGGRPGSVIRAGDYKLIEFFEGGRRELYNLARDAGEVSNLVESEPERVKELAGKLEAWRQAVGARRMQPNPDYAGNPQEKDGTVTLPARSAAVHGVMLRYEPLPHKNTLGFWVRASDWASFDFTITAPGTFAVQVLQGCGKGQGGSEVEFAVGARTLQMTVEDTGHFQNFKARDIGRMTLDKPGRYTMTVKPKKKAAAAVMDLRSVTLTPAKRD